MCTWTKFLFIALSKCWEKWSLCHLIRADGNAITALRTENDSIHQHIVEIANGIIYPLLHVHFLQDLDCIERRPSMAVLKRNLLEEERIKVLTELIGILLMEAASSEKMAVGILTLNWTDKIVVKTMKCRRKSASSWHQQILRESDIFDWHHRTSRYSIAHDQCTGARLDANHFGCQELRIRPHPEDSSSQM